MVHNVKWKQDRIHCSINILAWDAFVHYIGMNALFQEHVYTNLSLKLDRNTEQTK